MLDLLILMVHQLKHFEFSHYVFILQCFLFLFYFFVKFLMIRVAW